MSRIAKEFFRDWVASSLDPDAQPKANLKQLLAEAEQAGITRDELEEALDGNLLAAVKDAMALMTSREEDA